MLPQTKQTNKRAETRDKEKQRTKYELKQTKLDKHSVNQHGDNVCNKKRTIKQLYKRRQKI